MCSDPKEIVRSSYDAIADAYAEWSAGIRDPARQQWTRFLIERVPSGARVLDLGCGNGLPSTADLARHFDVTGVDISARQIEMARQAVPDATFVCSDVMDVSFPAEHFAAVTAFYSIIHLPRDEQPELLQRVIRWLEPGGYCVMVMGSGDADIDIDPDWLGAPMYWSHYPVDVNVALSQRAGFDVVSSSIVTLDEPDQPATFHWLVCRKPSGPHQVQAYTAQ